MRFNIIKREPSYFFENIHEDLNRFLKDTFGDMEYMDKTNLPVFKAFRPAVEIKEKNDQYKIKIELPNVAKEDIDVELTKNTITIKAESRFEECKEEENLRTSEFRYGKFQRVIPLEHEINPDDTKSEFKNGVLHIELPKIHEDKKEDVKKLKIE
ncbi:Hsp20/alpha crystallin family protein [bacterium]|nr:Hsp20/alpha crystallin family protein [bacterium]